MQLPGTLSFGIKAGPDPGSLTLTPYLSGPDGTLYWTGDPVPLAAGNTVSYGPIMVEVLIESMFQSDTSPVPAVKPANATPAPAVKPGAPGPARR